jgi:membrane protease YdiL (CAAX protease family)
MDTPARSPWNPDRLWADPLIALLALLALLASAYALTSRQHGTRRPAERASLQARLTEVALAGPRLVTRAKPLDWTKAEAQAKAPWDRALLAVLKAELEDQAEPTATWVERAAPPGPGGAAFRSVCLAAYGNAPLPTRSERDDIHLRLGGGHAANLLEARLRDREAGGEALRIEAKRALLLRLGGLGLLGLGVMALAVGGLTVGIYLLVTRRQPPLAPLPAWSMSGRAAAIVSLAWFLGFFVAGTLASLLVHPFPALRWAALPLGYALHVGWGLNLLSWAEDRPMGDLWRHLNPGRQGRDLAWGLAFLALAVLLVLAVALATNFVLKPEQSPQRDLQDLLLALRGWLPTLAMLLVIAGLAPLWEELLFRGFLLPILARHQRMVVALAVTALLFGAIHLQPLALPILSTLGLVLGLAMRHTGSLRTPILVHACWNAAQFLLMRAFA